MRYTQLINFEDEAGYVCKVAASPEQAVVLIEAGFTFETAINGVSLFKKRK